MAGMSEATKIPARRCRRRSAGRCGRRRSCSGSSDGHQRPARTGRGRAPASSAWRPRASRPPFFSSRATRCATISVSVSDWNLWPSAMQLVLQLEVVLDDAVVDDDGAAGVVAVRVGVLFGGPAVGGPARVADAVVAGERRRLQDVLEVATACRRCAAPRCRRRGPRPRPPSRSRGIRASAAPRRGRGRPASRRCSQRCRTCVLSPLPDSRCRGSRVAPATSPVPCPCASPPSRPCSLAARGRSRARRPARPR